MDKSVTESILAVCNALNKHNVEYMIVGGTAVALHGYFRWSYEGPGNKAEKYDLDIWYNPTYKNYFKLLDGLEEMGQDVSEFRAEQSPNPRSSFFKLEMERFALDLLPELKGLTKFRLSFKTKEVVSFNGIEIFVIGFEDLIKDKEAGARPKDLIDIKRLIEKRNTGSD